MEERIIRSKKKDSKIINAAKPKIISANYIEVIKKMIKWW